jgi:hypothetical protein
MRNFAKLGLGILLSTSTVAMASFRMPVFSFELLKTQSVGNWFGQNIVFRNERGDERERPIWVLAGDSLSSGWANSSSMMVRYQKAFRHRLPVPMSVADLFQHLPHASTTWYAGTDYDYGVFGFLDPEWALAHSFRRHPKWVLLATAFAGAKMLPEFSPSGADKGRDPMKLIQDLKHPERVKLFTMSLGANDTCDAIDSHRYQSQIEAKLVQIRNRYRASEPVYAVWKVPEVEKIWAKISRTLNALPERTEGERVAKARVKEYCQKAWQRFCPAVFTNPAAVARSRSNFNRLYAKHFGNTFDSRIDDMQKFSSTQLLNMLSADCFHPSLNGHRWVRDQMKVYLSKKGLPGRFD